MDFFFKNGFLGTRAPLFMDITLLIVVLLPILIAIAITFAKKNRYKLHAITQIVIYVISVIIILYFEVGIRLAGGYKALLIQKTSISHNYLIGVLIFHIIVATITLILWSLLVVKSYLDYNEILLLGSKKKIHKKIGLYTYFFIFLTAFSGIWVYLLLFVY